MIYYFPLFFIYFNLQLSIFDYREIENLGDLERLRIFFENINDEKLCEKLETTRKNGRNDYPVRTMLNLIYDMKIFGHRSVESFRRELSRNSQLRIACGLSEGKYKYCGERKHLVPPARVFTGFLNKLKNCKQEIEELFEELVKFMYDNLERFGEDCAIDGKFLDTYAKPHDKEKSKDNRADHEAIQYEKMKYLGYDKENNALRYTRYKRGKKIYRILLETDY